MLNRRTVITFEKLERCFYHLPNSEPVLGECVECRQEVSWLTPNEVVAFTGLTLREVFRRIEANSVHFSETAPGLIHICPNSISHDGDLMMPGDSPAQR
jgi:predicted DNA-binding transcriptional regulator AlpA